MTIQVQNRTINGITIFDSVFDDAMLTASAAETWPAGSVLARVTASGNYVRFAPAANDGSQIPVAVITQDEVFAAAGTQPSRIAVQGRFRLQDLVDAAGTQITAAAVVQLRDYAILALSTRQITIQDNQ